MSISTGNVPLPAAGIEAAPPQARRLGRSRIAIAVVLVLVALGVLAAVLTGSAPHPRLNPPLTTAAGLQRLGALPAQAQLTISAALATGDRRYDARPAPDGWQLRGGGVNAVLRGPAATLRSPRGTVSLRLAGVVSGPRSGPGVRALAGPASLRAHANRVSYRRGDVTQWFAGGPLGIEQGFTVARRPAGAGRSLTVALAVSGSLHAVNAHRSVDFVTASGRLALRYEALSARDAGGRRLPARLIVDRHTVRLAVTVSGARFPVTIDPFVQEAKLPGDASGDGFGNSVALSADGNTALVGADQDGGNAGAVFLFTRTGGTWSQSTKLVGSCTGSCANQGTGETGGGLFGESVALSDDGTVALIGAGGDASGAGAAWVFTRSGGAWTQQGAKLVGNCTSSCGSEGSGETGAGSFGAAVALSGNGNTAMIGAPNDNSVAGGVWVFTPSDLTWHQRGAELVGDCSASCANEGTGEVNGGTFGGGAFGASVASSADGSTLLIGAQTDNNGDGAAWRFVTGAGAYVQQGPKQVGNCFNNVCGDQGQGETSGGRFGSAVALSADGNTALVGAYQDGASTGNGAVWGFQRAVAGASAGQWSQIGTKFTGTAGCTTNCGFGWSLALSADGTTGLTGGDFGDTAVLFTVSAEGLIQQGSALVGNCTSNCTNQGTGELGTADFGRSVALSSDALTAFVGGPNDGVEGSPAGIPGAAWAFGPPPPVNSSRPQISGSPAVGSTLSCSQGTWSGNPTAYAYGWNRDGQPISGTTASSYQVTGGDAGGALTCTVTASNGGGSARATSDPVSVPGSTTSTTTASTTTSATTTTTTAPSGLAFTITPDVDPLLTGQTVTFAVTAPAAGSDYSWTFGDGATGDGASVTHAFAAAGVDTVTVSAGGAATTQRNVVVVDNQPPTAGFTILRSAEGSGEPGASTAVTHPVTIVPQATLPQVGSTAQDRIVREDFWLGGDGPPDAPDVTCLPNGVCSEVAGLRELGTGNLLPDGHPYTGGNRSFCDTVSAPRPLQRRAHAQIGQCTVYAPTAGYESFSVNFWTRALARIGSPSEPQMPVLPQEESVATAGGVVAPPLTVGYPPLTSVDLATIDGYQGEQGVPYAGCFPGNPYIAPGFPSNIGSTACNALISPLQVPFPAENNFRAAEFGPYDLAHYGVNSPQQLEDQANFLYNYATVAGGIHNPLDSVTGPAIGATANGHDPATPRTITMVAVDSEGLASAPVSQKLPLTPPHPPTLNLCVENVGNTPCVAFPTHGTPNPIPITAGVDTLRFKQTSGTTGSDDPIAYYTVSIGQPDNGITIGPGNKKYDICVIPSFHGSWTLSSQPPAPVTVAQGGGGSPSTLGTGQTITGTQPPSGPKAGIRRGRRRPAVRVFTGPGGGTDTPPLPPFSDLLAGAFPAHSCDAFAERNVDAGTLTAPPHAGPNVVLHSHAVHGSPVPGLAPVATLGDATAPSSIHPAVTVAGPVSPVLVTTSRHNLDVTFPKEGVYSVSVAAYTTAGLGAIARYDGFLAVKPQHAGRCETIDSKSVNLGTVAPGFSGNCVTVIASRGGSPKLYVSSGIVDVDGVPVAPQRGDSIVINPNLGRFYVRRCSVSNQQLVEQTSANLPCGPPAAGKAGTLYLALGSGAKGEPGIAQQPDFNTARASVVFTPLGDGETANGDLLPIDSVSLLPHEILSLPLHDGSGGSTSVPALPRLNRIFPSLIGKRVGTKGIGSLLPSLIGKRTSIKGIGGRLSGLIGKRTGIKGIGRSLAGLIESHLGVVNKCVQYPGALPWGPVSGARYQGFLLATQPCVAFTKSYNSRVAFWTKLPNAFGNHASTQAATSQVLLYGRDQPAVSNLVGTSYPTVARARPTPRPIIAGSPVNVRARAADNLPGFPPIPNCPPQTNNKSGMSIPSGTDLGPLSLPAGASFCFIQKTGDFVGNVNVNIPSPAPFPINNVEVGFELGHGQLINAGGEISGNIPVGPVLINDLKFDIQTNPTVVAGAITASIADVLSVDAGVVIRSYSSANTPSVDLQGTVGIAGIQFGNFGVDFTPQGISLNASISKDFGIGSINITVKGAVGFSPAAFYLEGGGKACLFICLGVTGLISNEGLAACGSIDLVFVSFSGGIGIKWDNPGSGVHLFTGCDLDSYIPPSLLSLAHQHLVRSPVARAGPSGAHAVPAAPVTQPLLDAGGKEKLKLNPGDICAPHTPGSASQPDGCHDSTVAVQVHSLVSGETVGATPLVTLTGPTGDTRTISAPSTPGYWGLLADAAPSGAGNPADSQSMLGTSLVDQNPAPVDDGVGPDQGVPSSAYCQQQASSPLPTAPTTCPKVTTTTLFVGDPGPGPWTMTVQPGSPQVVDVSVAQQEPAVTAADFNPTVHSVSLTPKGSGFEVTLGGHRLSSSLIPDRKLLLAPSVQVAPGTPAGYRELLRHPLAANLDVPSIDESRLRGVMVKVPHGFAGSVALIDAPMGTAATTAVAGRMLGVTGPAMLPEGGEVIASGLTGASVPRGGLPIVFQPLPDAGAHQQLFAFLSNDAGLPSRVVPLVTFASPPVPVPRAPTILQVLRTGSTVRVLFRPGDVPVANGVNLAVSASNGQSYQGTFAADQLERVGRMDGLDAARQGIEYAVTIHGIEPSSTLHLAIDGSNEGRFSPAGTGLATADARAISAPALLALAR